MKNKFLTIGLTAMLIFSGGSLMSQAPPGPPPPPPPPDTSGPIDSGSLALLMAVSLYGYKQLKKQPAD